MIPLTSKERVQVTPCTAIQQINGQLISVEILDEGLDLPADRIVIAEVETWNASTQSSAHCVTLLGRDRTIGGYPGTVSRKTFPLIYLTDAGISALKATPQADGTHSWVLK
jgi:hypothetical protein